MKKFCRVLDDIYYIVAQFGIFIAAYKGSLLWVCVFGFCLIDGAMAQIFIHQMKRNKEGAE